MTVYNCYGSTPESTKEMDLFQLKNALSSKPNEREIQLNIEKACFEQSFFKTRFFYSLFYQGLLSKFNRTLFKN